jgi:uncharacterized membrane protein
MSDTTSPQQPDRLRRWLGPALLISVVINLFLVGLMVTAMLVHRPAKHGEFRSPPPSFFGMMKRGAAELPPADRAAMRDIMVQQFPIIRPYFAKIDAARRELADVIATSPYDPVKVGAAFAKIDAAQAEMVRATREAMIQGFGKMDEKQRIRLADAMRKQADRRLRGKIMQEGDGPPPGASGAMGLGLNPPPPPGSPDGPQPQ